MSQNQITIQLFTEYTQKLLLQQRWLLQVPRYTLYFSADILVESQKCHIYVNLLILCESFRIMLIKMGYACYYMWLDFST